VAPGIKFLFLGDCAVYVQISLRSTSCLQVPNDVKFEDFAVPIELGLLGV
jgi:hypothetical protein